MESSGVALQTVVVDPLRNEGRAGSNTLYDKYKHEHYHFKLETMQANCVLLKQDRDASRRLCRMMLTNNEYVVGAPALARQPNRQPTLLLFSVSLFSLPFFQTSIAITITITAGIGIIGYCRYRRQWCSRRLDPHHLGSHRRFRCRHCHYQYQNHLRWN
jgi:hypothetical protein